MKRTDQLPTDRPCEVVCDGAALRDTLTVLAARGAIVVHVSVIAPAEYELHLFYPTQTAQHTQHNGNERVKESLL